MDYRSISWREIHISTNYGEDIEIHPITIIFVIIVFGKLFGILGIILAVPGYAILKVIVMNLFEWFKSTTEWYDPIPEMIEKEEGEEIWIRR